MYVCMSAVSHVCLCLSLSPRWSGNVVVEGGRICVFVCMCLCMYACLHVSMYVCMYVCMYVRR